MGANQQSDREIRQTVGHQADPGIRGSSYLPVREARPHRQRVGLDSPGDLPISPLNGRRLRARPGRSPMSFEIDVNIPVPEVIEIDVNVNVETEPLATSPEESA